MDTILILANDSTSLYLHRKELISKLVKSYEVHISVPDGRYTQHFTYMGCKFINTPINRRGTNFITDTILLINYIKMIQRLKPKVVLSYTIKPNVFGGLACRILSVPYIANVTGLGTAIQNQGLLKKLALHLYKAGLKNASCIFFQNNENLQLFKDLKIIKGNERLIPGSGVNLELHNLEEYPEDIDEIKLLFIGRIMKDKGIEELLEAASAVKQKYPNVQFHLIGGMEEDYANIVCDFEKKGVVRYHGFQDDIRTFIKNSHATVHPSYHEGLANVLLESAATGRPVLASRVAGCVETFDEGVSGYGFEAKSVDSLVKALIRFIQTPHEAKKAMGLAGRRKMEKEYNRNIVIDAYLDEIKKAMGRMG